MKKQIGKKILYFLFKILLLSSFLVSPASAAATFEVGKTYGSTVLWSAPSGETIQDWEAFTTPVPGMSCVVTTTTISISGTPTTPGTYTWSTTVDCTNSGGNVTFTVVVNPAPTAPPASTVPAVTAPPEVTAAPATPVPAANITQHPLDVTVTEGGNAKFSANATDWAWCAWRFVSPDGQETVIFDVVGPKFPGLKVTGGNSLTMEITDIPMELNGWKAVCLFVDAGNGMKVNEGGTITVTE